MAAWSLLSAVAVSIASAPAYAQQPAPPAGAEERQKPSPPSQFLRDIAGDYKNFISLRTGAWLGVGGGAALAIHPYDDDLSQEATDESVTLTGGQEYGGVPVQLSLAMIWWAAGHATGSARATTAGLDLLRGQLSAVSWTYALKYSTNRTRPDGTARSFPSGHSSSTFATAIVLEDHYGWKLGLPAFAAATYTASSRVTANRHWASDVVFGAFLGMASGRTVTSHLRVKSTSITAVPVPGGGGLLLAWGGAHENGR